MPVIPNAKPSIHFHPASCQTGYPSGKRAEIHPESSEATLRGSKLSVAALKAPAASLHPGRRTYPLRRLRASRYCCRPRGHPTLSSPCSPLIWVGAAVRKNRPIRPGLGFLPRHKERNIGPFELRPHRDIYGLGSPSKRGSGVFVVLTKFGT